MVVFILPSVLFCGVLPYGWSITDIVQTIIKNIVSKIIDGWCACTVPMKSLQSFIT